MNMMSEHNQDAGVPQADILLVSMPFGPLNTPALGLGLLAAQLRNAGMVVHVRYFTFDFAREIGEDRYMRLASGWPLSQALLGEWMFSECLHGCNNQEPYITDVLLSILGAPPEQNRTVEEHLKTIREDIDVIRERIPRFMKCVRDTILKTSPKIVGFTTMFQQNTASLVAAREVKLADPRIKIVFGGANCEGPMGEQLQRSFEWLDVVVSGEADHIIVELMTRLLQGQACNGIPRVTSTVGGTRTIVRPERTASRSLDSLPFADHSDYFKQYSNSGLRFIPAIPFEASRGCWWGELHHCTFCGLNGESMAYRSKSPESVLSELRYQLGRYGIRNFLAVDNIIDMSYFSTLLPTIYESKLNISLFFETKANLTREQIGILRSAGVMEIQPGIESLSTSVLQLMHKGVTALQNIQTLKWCSEMGVRPQWGVIWGFPHEQMDEYLRMEGLIPLLAHLPPPLGTARIRLDRFSPNFIRSRELGFADVRPAHAYAFVYELPEDEVRHLAYFFDYTYDDGRNPYEYTAAMVGQIRAWQRYGPIQHLIAIQQGASLLIFDTRECHVHSVYLLKGIFALLYSRCDRICSLVSLEAYVAEHVPDSSAGELVQSFITIMTELKLLVREEGRFLALAACSSGSITEPALWSRIKVMAEMIGRGKLPAMQYGDVLYAFSADAA